MARKTANYTVEDEGRDKGKIFVITELSASRAESWAFRVLLALMASNVEVPEGVEKLGMAGLALVGFKALNGLKWELAEPLLAEMLECVRIIPNPKNAMVIRELIEDDIEEVATRMNLRKEVFALHTDFFEAGVKSLFPQKAPAANKANTSHTRTSRR